MNFEHSETIKVILPALIEVQKEMPQLSKDADNPHARSKYVTLDNILGHLLPLLNKRDILLTQMPIEENDGNNQSIGVETLFWHKDGEYIKYPAVLYSFEKGGKMNLTQSVGSIISYARRYALTSILALSTADDNDGVQPNYRQQNREQEEYVQEVVLVNQGDVKKINDKIIVLAGLEDGNLKENQEKWAKKIADQAQVNSVREIPKEYLGSLLGMLDRMIGKAQAKSTEEQPEQTSLMDGNTTKAQGSD